MWTPLVVVLVILAAIGLSYVALAAPIPDPPTTDSGLSAREIAAQRLEIARMEADARRNALATGAGFVAIAALILAFHRQRHHERSTANAEADALRRQEHAERTAATAEDDALQRRITDARIRAVDQLGSDNPVVRIGGLHNLERIGQQHPELRQVVLDEICAYLRLPYPETLYVRKPEKPKRTVLPPDQFEPIGPPPADVRPEPEPQSGDKKTEREVRLIAQEILQRHLRSRKGDQYWKHTRLNLKNAWLDGLELTDCSLTRADFSGASFAGSTRFEGVTFRGSADFGQATFEDCEFRSVTFTKDAYFWRATFLQDASIARVQFRKRAYFVNVNFKAWASFQHSTFTGPAIFRDEISDLLYASPRVRDPESFEGATFANEQGHKLPADWALEPDTGSQDWSRAVYTRGK